MRQQETWRGPPFAGWQGAYTSPRVGPRRRSLYREGPDASQRAASEGSRRAAPDIVNGVAYSGGAYTMGRTGRA